MSDWDDWIRVSADKVPDKLPENGETVDLLLFRGQVIEGCLGDDGTEAWWFEDMAGNMLSLETVQAWRPAQSVCEASDGGSQSG